MLSKAKQNRGGRPPKFDEPGHPVTMTLPERILDQLAAIDPDRARAVVKVTEAVAGTGQGRFSPIELIEMAPGKSLIVVGPSKALKMIPWLKMIEIARTRYLLTIPTGMSVEALEVSLRDLLSEPELEKNERENDFLHKLLDIIGHQRRRRGLSKAEVLIFDTGQSTNLPNLTAKRRR